VTAIVIDCYGGGGRSAVRQSLELGLHSLVSRVTQVKVRGNQLPCLPQVRFQQIPTDRLGNKLAELVDVEIMFSFGEAQKFIVPTVVCY
jgi:hypothetical protein